MTDSQSSAPQTPSTDDDAAPTPTSRSSHDAPQHGQQQNDVPGTDVVLASTLDARIRYARQIAAAGTLLPKAVRDGVSPKDVEAIAARAFLITETGGMLGIHPIAALQGVQVIEGKPTLSPALMQTLVRRAGHRFRIRIDGTVAGGDIAAVATIVRSDDPEPFTCRWDLERAVRAGLCSVEVRDGVTSVRARSSRDDAMPWEKYTEAMLKARATSEVCRDAAGDVLMGAHYTPEEMGAAVNADGEFVDLGHLPATPVVAAASDEQTPAQVAAAIMERAQKCATVDALRDLWRTAGAVVERHPWATEYGNLRDFADRTVVAHPHDGDVQRIPLSEAFAILVADRKAGADQAPPPAPTPAEDVQDAEVVEDAHDPWSDGSAQASPAVQLVVDHLGGTVIDDGGPQAPRDRVAAEHAAQLADREQQEERDSAHEDLGGTVPPNGREALAAARAALAERNKRRATSTTTDEERKA